MNQVAAPAAVSKKQISKTQYEDLFVKAFWILHVWDPTNKQAHKHKEIAQQHLDPQWCVRASHQISDLDLRHRWLQARYDQLLAISRSDPNPVSLPRVVPEVRRHMEREFEKSYPKGVTDLQTGNL